MQLKLFLHACNEECIFNLEACNRFFLFTIFNGQIFGTILVDVSLCSMDGAAHQKKKRFTNELETAFEIKRKSSL